VNIKDSLCNKHCRFSLHDVSGKLVPILDSVVGSGWGNLHWNGDGEFLWGRGEDEEYFMGTGWGWEKFYLPCHSVVFFPRVVIVLVCP